MIGCGTSIHYNPHSLFCNGVDVLRAEMNCHNIEDGYLIDFLLIDD